MPAEVLNNDSRLKSSLKQTLHALARNDFLWKAVWLPMARFGRHMTWQRSVKELNRIEAQLRPDYQVQAGIFAGMRYPHFKSIGSALLAKLIGTYEVELADVLTEIIGKPYETIVDVGCAEGYYAVGLALKIPGAKVFAFDINTEARQLCDSMARLNEVENRLTVEGSCTTARLSEIVAGKRTLVISDCEGNELDLFDQSTVVKLAHCDLLIEAHDFIRRGVSRALQDRFQATHKCRVIHSMDPLEKAQRHPSRMIREESREVLTWLYSEGRPEIMEWLWLTPRSDASAKSS